MESIASLLVIGGFGLSSLAFVLIITHAFRTSALWGVLVLLFPIAAIAFIARHWDAVRDAALLGAYGVGFLLAGGLLLEG